jgi:hypothetical protein
LRVINTTPILAFDYEYGFILARAMAARPKIPQWFQWVASPVICNGPMIGAACPALANAVSKARGVGAHIRPLNVTLRN